MRYIAQHLDGGIQQAFAPTREPANEPERQADGAANGEAK